MGRQFSVAHVLSLDRHGPTFALVFFESTLSQTFNPAHCRHSNPH